MDDSNAEAQVLASRDELDKVSAELQRMRQAGEWNWTLLEQLSPAAHVAFEVMLIEALATWPRTAQRRLREALIVHGYDEQCARRVMSDNLPEGIRAAFLHATLRPTGDTGPLTLPDHSL
ncbi:MAG TPA: hypothetical protein VKA60_17350 [Blastocatellia bacterium]|nr:hypothetical protein [Blastocatellia bacterium]